MCRETGKDKPYDLVGELGSSRALESCRQTVISEEVGKVELNLADGLLVEAAVVDGVGAEDPDARRAVANRGIRYKQANFGLVWLRILNFEDESSLDATAGVVNVSDGPSLHVMLGLGLRDLADK